MLHSQGDIGDPRVMAEVLGHIRQKLSGKYRYLDEHLLDASVEDALMRYLESPDRFDAARCASLNFYLELWTRSYLDKRLRKMKRF